MPPQPGRPPAEAIRFDRRPDVQLPLLLFGDRASPAVERAAVSPPPGLLL
jgi:hypothetical protein